MLLTCICTKLPFSKRQRLRKPPGRSVSAVRPGHLLQPQNDLPASLSPLCTTSVQPPGFNFRRLTQLRFPPSGPLVREICNQMPNPSISAPPPRSYRLRRHFPRHCDVSTRAEHPYLPRFLPRDTLSTGSSPSGKRNFYSESQDLQVSGGRTLAPPRTCGCYQLAFVTPGISPFEAISRNWIRLMPNRRM